MSPILTGAFLFIVSFFVFRSGLRECLDYGPVPTARRVSGLFLAAARGPSNKDARAHGDVLLATSRRDQPLPRTVSSPLEVPQSTHKFRRRPPKSLASSAGKRSPPNMRRRR